MTIAEKLQTIAENEQKVFDAGYAKGQAEGGGGYDEGVQAEYDRFWDAYQDNGNRANYTQAFYGIGWTDDSYNPKYPINATARTGGEEMFRDSMITDTKVDIIATNNFSSYTFVSCALLKTIRKLVVDENTVYPRWFDGCYALENITFDGTIGASLTLSHASKLTDASVQSIIDHLADLTGQTAQTLTFHATVGGKLTEAQKAAITAKNWTLVY